MRGGSGSLIEITLIFLKGNLPLGRVSENIYFDRICNGALWRVQVLHKQFLLNLRTPHKRNKQEL